MLLALPLCLGAAMVACAQVTGQRGVVFPEAAALAFGTWVMGRPDWRESRWRLAVTPVLAAALGLVASDLITVRILAELVALSAALAVLLALPSRLTPSLSAAVLPTVFGIHTWVYPVAVLALSVAVLVGAELTGRPVRGSGSQGNGSWGGAARWPLPHAGVLYVASALWLATVAVAGLPRVAAAPPLLVSGAEWIMEGGAGVPAALRRGVAIVTAWAAGAVAVWQIPSVALAGVASLMLASALVWGWNVRHAPVLAMSLVAEVAGPPASWAGLARGAAGVALAVAALYALGSVMAWALAWRIGPGDSERGRDAGQHHSGRRGPPAYDRHAAAERGGPGGVSDADHSTPG